MRAEADTSPSGGTGKRDLALAMGVGLAVYAWMWTRFRFVCDDAYISFRYTRRLVEGHGLRFNLAEHPPVEGYSNLLWVLWLAPFESLGVSLQTASVVTSGLCGAILIALFSRFAQRRLELRAAPLVASAAVLASLPPFAVWSSGGLETMAFALAVFLAFERLSLDPAHPRFVAAGVAGMAAALLRPDGVIWIGVVLGCAVLAAPREETRRALRAAFLAGLLSGVALLGQLAFRLAYYHEWTPNTLKAKAGISALSLERGSKYVASLVLEQPFLLLLPLAILAWSSARTRLALAAMLAVVFSGAYSILVGGDFMTMGRFVVPAMPFLALVFATLAHEAYGASRRMVSLGALSAVVLLCSMASIFDASPLPAAWRQRVHFRWNAPDAHSEFQQWKHMHDRAESWARIGRALAPHAEPGTPMYLRNLGAMSYFTEVHALDPYGLIDPQVARRPASGVRSSPGHDKAVLPQFFTSPAPVYLRAWIAPADKPPEAGLRPVEIEFMQAAGSWIEHFELAPGPDIQPGEELRVMRMPKGPGPE